MKGNNMDFTSIKTYQELERNAFELEQQLQVVLTLPVKRFTSVCYKLSFQAGAIEGAHIEDALLRLDFALKDVLDSIRGWLESRGDDEGDLEIDTAFADIRKVKDHMCLFLRSVVDLLIGKRKLPDALSPDFKAFYDRGGAII